MSRIYDRICEELASLRPRRDKIEVPRELIGGPLPGWRESTGWPNLDTVRQWRDGVIHIHETTRETYRIHRDKVDPHLQPMKHLLFDMPWLVASLAILLLLGVAGAAVALG